MSSDDEKEDAALQGGVFMRRGSEGTSGAKGHDSKDASCYGAPRM